MDWWVKSGLCGGLAGVRLKEMPYVVVDSGLRTNPFLNLLFGCANSPMIPQLGLIWIGEKVRYLGRSLMKSPSTYRVQVLSLCTSQKLILSSLKNCVAIS